MIAARVEVGVEADTQYIAERSKSAIGADVGKTGARAGKRMGLGGQDVGKRARCPGVFTSTLYCCNVCMSLCSMNERNNQYDIKLL
jgi:hypothetical protein